MVNEALFWIVAIITVTGSLSLLFARKGAHIAMSIVTVMCGLAAAYVGLGAPFLGVVQIVVYTGAVMMLFLFVLMLVGVDQRESLKETIKGQRWIALAGAGGMALLLISVIGRVEPTSSDQFTDGNPEEIALVLFSQYVLVMEVLGALLITAAVGALVLTHTPRLKPRHSQVERRRRASSPVPTPSTSRCPVCTRATTRSTCLRSTPRASPSTTRSRVCSRRVTRRRRAPSSATSWRTRTTLTTRRSRPMRRRATRTTATRARVRGVPMNPMNYVILAAILFSIGAAAVLLRRNAIVAFMGVE
ncbi:hypothetical protein GCM10025876_23050 [Demequina litorisediminis]|uniref:NADH-quinone oxidoreductase subunit J n=1 Tax=Demequina litorisediminis TaxID=1849022 RepID=A0ABQ6IEH8_9MICO|nr:hypothetical protein GCM10025876_23050 [Demequina litorisediminis]